VSALRRCLDAAPFDFFVGVFVGAAAAALVFLGVITSWALYVAW
jgi:hypothetical protein